MTSDLGSFMKTSVIKTGKSVVFAVFFSLLLGIFIGGYDNANAGCSGSCFDTWGGWGSNYACGPQPANGECCCCSSKSCGNMHCSCSTTSCNASTICSGTSCTYTNSDCSTGTVWGTKCCKPCSGIDYYTVWSACIGHVQTGVTPHWYSGCNSCSSVASAKACNSTPTVPTLTGPSSTGFTLVNYDFTASNSTDADGDTIRYQFDWDNNGTVDQSTGFVASGTPQTVGHTWSTAGSVGVKTRACDSLGVCSAWSNVISITFSVAIPSKPTLTGPTTGVVNTSYSFTATSTDSGAQNIKYQFDWDNNGTADQDTAFVASGTAQTLPYQWPLSGTKVFKVKACNVLGICSSWSDTLSFFIPDCVADLNPAWSDCSQNCGTDGTQNRTLLYTDCHTELQTQGCNQVACPQWTEVIP